MAIYLQTFHGEHQQLPDGRLAWELGQDAEGRLYRIETVEGEPRIVKRVGIDDAVTTLAEVHTLLQLVCLLTGFGVGAEVP